MSDDLAAAMEPVARALCGDFNAKLSTKTQLRFGKNGSMEIILAKGVFHDHETDDKGGVLDLIKLKTGREGKEAFEWMREIGIPLEGRPNGQAKANGSHRPPPADERDYVDDDQGRGEPVERGKQTIFATFDFVDLDSVLQYQEVRFQFKLPNGNWELQNGKPKKQIRQRRPDPDKQDAWIWNLGDVSHGLYNFPEIREEMLLPEDERSIVFVPEGPGKCEALKSWGLLATSNSGGAAHWLPHHAQEFQGADVVILVDNDDPGRKRAIAVAASLRGIAKRVRVLDFADLVSDFVAKGDVIDWRDRYGGTKEKLFAIVEKLKDWKPEPYKSKFGAVQWSELDQKREPYEWLIRDFLPANERTMMYGEPSCGKSFAALDIALSVARGLNYEKHNTRQAGVIYCAFEGGKGFPTRVEGYRQHHELELTDGTPFVILTRSVDLFEDEDACKNLREEIDYWRSTFRVPLGLTVFDTVSASSGSMDDSQGKDVAKYLGNGKKIMDGLNSATLYVHHVAKNSGGSPRGSGKWTGDLEATIEVHLDPHNAVDDRGRPVRVVHLKKQREGKGGREVKRFVLSNFVIGKDDTGQDINACILTPPGGDAATSSGKKYEFAPRQQEAKVFAAFWAALDKHGTPPPPEAINPPPGDDGKTQDGVPPSVQKVVDYRYWKEEYEAKDIVDGEEDSKRNNRVKMAMKRGGESLMKFSVINRFQFNRTNQLFWWTGKPVRGFPKTFPKLKAVEDIKPDAPGESIDF